MAAEKVGSGYRGRHADLLTLEFRRQELVLVNEQLSRRLMRLRLAALTVLEAGPEEMPAARERLRHEVALCMRHA